MYPQRRKSIIKMKSYALVSVLSFGLGLGLSLTSYINFEWVVIFLIIIGSLIKILLSLSPISGNQLKYGAALALPFIMNKLKKTERNGGTVKIEKQRIIIEFDHKGKKRRHILPYDRKQLSKHNNHTDHLVDHDGTETEIIHVPGTKHAHTAEELGGKALKVVNKLTKDTKVYEKEVPKF